MPTLARSCPACKCEKALETTGDGRVTCVACGKSFRLRSASVPPANAAAPGPATAAALPREPLGPEPPPADYTLLTGVAYACLAFAVGMAVYQAVSLFNMQLLPQLNPLSMKTSGLLGIASSILTGLLLLQMVKHVTRLDRQASWLAWRCGGLREPLGLPPGSNLPYLLPLCVAGGLLVIFGVASLSEEIYLPSELTSWLILAAGIVLFLSGLALAEVRRFLWRMSMLGHALARRSRGDEVGLEPPRQKGARPAGHLASHLIRIAMLLLLVAFLSSAGPPLSTLSRDQVPALGITGALFLAIVGSSYALFRLTHLFYEMLDGWVQAEPHVSGRSTIPPAGDKPARAFMAIALIVGALMLLCGLYFLLRIFSQGRGSDMGMYSLILPLVVVSGLGALACLLGWLAFLKKDSCQFVQVSATVSRTPVGRYRCQPLTRFPAMVLLCIAGVQTVLSLTSTIGWSSFMRGIDDFVFFAFIGLSHLSTSALPLFWCVLVCLDLDRSAGHLEACYEVKRPEK
jgi:hypothetical protein